MIRRILPKAYAALLLYMAELPLFLLPAAALIPGEIWLAAVLPVPALALTGAAGLLPARRRTAALAFAALIMAAGCALLFLPARPTALLLFLPCLLIMLLFMPAMARPAHRELTASHLGFGVILHIAAQFLKAVPLFQGVAAALTWCFTAYLIACLFSVNRTVLTGNSPGASKTLLLGNRKLLAGLSVLALLLTNVDAVGAAVKTAIVWMIMAFAAVIKWINSLFAQGVPAEGMPSGSPFSGLEEASEPGLFAKILEVFLSVLAALIAAALLYFAVRFLIRFMRKLFSAALERLSAYRRRISADYDDQSESLLDWGEIKRITAERISRIRRRYMPTPWERLSPARRVRRVYALLLRRSGQPDPALTARETLQSGAFHLRPDDAATFAALYDRARYSDHPIAVQDADDLRKRAGV